MKLKYPNRKWKTKKGDILYIERMETSHIVNCINMLKRGGFIPCFFYNDSEESVTMLVDDLIEEVIDNRFQALELE